MNLQVISFLSSNIPILLGAIIFLFLLKVNPLSSRYILIHEKQVGMKNPWLIESNELESLLIINGLRKDAINKSKFVWFDKLSLLASERKPQNSLTLVTKGNFNSELCRAAYSNSPTFGLLIPYLLDSSLSGVEA